MRSALWLLLLTAMVRGSAKAAVLTFDAGVGNGAAIPADYGDRISDTELPPFWYGETHGMTPNILAYHDLRFWQSGFGALSAVATVPERTGVGSITLVADPGYIVGLHGLQLAGWFETDYTINRLSVWSDDVLVWEQTDLLVLGDLSGGGFTTIDFQQPMAALLHPPGAITGHAITGHAITIEIDATNLGRSADNIGLDNLTFSQSLAGVSIPEPAMPLALTTIAALALRRR